MSTEHNSRTIDYLPQQKHPSTDWSPLLETYTAHNASIIAHLNRMNGNGNGHAPDPAEQSSSLVMEQPVVKAVDMGMKYTVKQAVYTVEKANVRKASDELKGILHQDITPGQYRSARHQYLNLPEDHDHLHTGRNFYSYLVFSVMLAASEKRPSVAGSWKALDRALHAADWYQKWHDEKYADEGNLPYEYRTQYSELDGATINENL